MTCEWLSPMGTHVGSEVRDRRPQVVLSDYLWLFFAGALAASVNAAAGGGTLLSFPSLMAAGLTPLAANATSTVGLLSGYLASVAGYRTDMRQLRGEVLFTIVPSIIGGALGAWLLVAMGAAFFARIVP